MHPLCRARLAFVSGLAFVAACSAQRSETEPEDVARDAGAWYRRSATLDLDADGRADSAVLVALGARPDSLEVALTLYVGSAAAHTETWESDYELVDVEPGVRERPRLDEYMRGRLDRALASVSVEPLDTGSVRAMSETPEILEELSPRPTTQVSFAYGYESNVVLAWDAVRRRFVHLWSCC